MPTSKMVPTFWARIYMAGDIATAMQVCREECWREGLCVTVRPCEYIYTGGQESGFEVGLINYPRFPATPKDLMHRATLLAHRLVERCCQDSYLIMTPDETIWESRREV